MNRNLFDRKKRQFKNLANQVNCLIFNRQWDKLSFEARNRLIFKLNSLFRELSHFFSQLELKKILAAAVIFIGFPLVSQSQQFAPPIQNPFGITSVHVDYAWPVFADIDNDEDFDLFTGNVGGSMQFYENTGTVTTPLFAPPQQDPFGLIPVQQYAWPAFADIDNDGDLDLLIGEINGNFQFFENIGTETNPQFAAPQQNPFGLTHMEYFAIPEFADIDNDGDFDLFATERNGIMKLYENVGDGTLASFGTPIQNPFGILPAFVMGTPAFTDIDNDGDLDLFEGVYYGNMLYYENTGTVATPVFAYPITNPFGLVPTYYNSLPAFADIDGDGAEDLLVGEYLGNFQYFENATIHIGIPENPRTTLFDLYPNPANDEVFLRMANEHSGLPSEVSIMDLNGKKIKTVLLDTDDLRLKTDDLSPGVYFVRLIKDDEVYTRKLIIR